MIDQLGGWSLKTVGQSYGDGYDLKTLSKYLELMSSTAPRELAKSC